MGLRNGLDIIKKYIKYHFPTTPTTPSPLSQPPRLHSPLLHTQPCHIPQPTQAIGPSRGAHHQAHEKSSWPLCRENCSNIWNIQGCIDQNDMPSSTTARARQGCIDENDMPSSTTTWALQGCIDEKHMPSNTTTWARQGCFDQNDMPSITTTWARQWCFDQTDMPSIIKTGPRHGCFEINGMPSITTTLCPNWRLRNKLLGLAKMAKWKTMSR